MKTKITLAILAIAFVFISNQSKAQTEVYTVTSAELLFQWADIKFTDAAIAAGDQQLGNPLRFTAWFHLGQYVHMDFTDNIGLFTGLAVRNVGLISDERLDVNGTVNDYKIIRRTYNLGVPLAIKLGSFNNHFYFFGGGEIEMAYAYKEKYWKANSRSGAKTKYVEWFGDQASLFKPSVFGGVQFPGGVNVKFKYYFDNYLNNSYSRSDPNEKPSDLTRYENSQVMYISVCWQFPTREIKSTIKREEKMTAL